jgi:hypothetical protein
VASRGLEFLVPLPFYCNFAYFKIASIKGTVGASHVSKVKTKSEITGLKLNTYVMGGKAALRSTN